MNMRIRYVDEIVVFWVLMPYDILGGYQHRNQAEVTSILCFSWFS